MAGKRWMLWAAMGALMAVTGCCRFCERWCGPEHPNCCGYQQPAPACCTPCTPCCPQGTVPSQYPPTQPVPGGNQTWQRTYTQPVNGQNCCQ